MSNKFVDIFSSDISSNESNEKQSDFFPSENTYQEKEETQKSFNEQRYINKLSLRKKKINDIIHSKRLSEMNMVNTIKIFSNEIYGNTEHEIIEFDKKDFFSGDIYVKLKNAYESKNEQGILEILDDISSYVKDKKIDNQEMKELLLKCGCNITNSQSPKNQKFPMAYLLYKIGLSTENKLIYIHCFNHLLNFSFTSDEFCQEINTSENINLILEKLIHFYPLFIENTLSNNLDELSSNKKVETFFIGQQILKLLGNVYVSSNNLLPFQMNNFYDKIFYLLYTFNLEEKNSEYKGYYYEFLETLIWLLTSFLGTDENFVVNYKDKILMIIPPLLEDIKQFYFTKAIITLEQVLEFIRNLCNLNSDFVKQIVDADGLKTLIKLFAYLFNVNPSLECDIELNIKSVDILLNIFVNIFCLDSKYLKFFDDYSSLALILEKLIDIFKLHPLNHFEIQRKLISILSNLACYNDINDIYTKILMNKKLIMNLFNYYYTHHEFDIIFFISNVFQQQSKNVRDFIKTLGAFDIIKNSICKSDNIMIKKISIKALYQLIKNEKAYDIRGLFDELYNTSIPEKIKAMFYDNKVNNENDSDKLVENKDENIPNMLQSLITDFEKYEKSLEYD